MIVFDPLQNFSIHILRYRLSRVFHRISHVFTFFSHSNVSHSSARVVVLFDLRCTNVLERSFQFAFKRRRTNIGFRETEKQKKVQNHFAVFQFIAQINVCAVNQGTELGVNQ